MVPDGQKSGQMDRRTDDTLSEDNFRTCRVKNVNIIDERSDGRTKGQTSRKKYAPLNFSKVGGIILPDHVSGSTKNPSKNCISMEEHKLG